MSSTALRDLTPASTAKAIESRWSTLRPSELRQDGYDGMGDGGHLCFALKWSAILVVHVHSAISSVHALSLCLCHPPSEAMLPHGVLDDLWPQTSFAVLLSSPA